MSSYRYARTFEIAVRCYPREWRDRHGDEAIELAELLVRDGRSPVLVAWSYLRGAAREQLVARPSRRLRPALAVLVDGATVIAVPLVLLDSSTPANAASSGEVVAVISNRSNAVGQLESAFKLHHFNIKVEEEPTAPTRVGSILAVKAGPEKAGGHVVLREIAGPCLGGASGCIDAIAVPLHYTGKAQVFVGRLAKPGETYFASANILCPGEPLRQRWNLGKTVVSPAHDLPSKDC
ncbi:MAG: hypothetical protein ACLQRM_18930 [Acidimicrobiales bacterium]